MILRTHPKFVKKNATASFNPTDLPIPHYSDNKEICPIFNLQKYLEKIDDICTNKNLNRPDQLFIQSDLKPFTTHQLRASVREIIFRADPLSNQRNPTFHSVRKIAATMLDYRGFSLEHILNSMQWKSSNTYLKYYCQIGLVPQTNKGCVIAGNVLPST